MTDINSFIDPASGWDQVIGTAINDQGQIIGSVGGPGEATPMSAVVWEDGHDYGIYNWYYLRKLCPCAECRK